MSEADDTDTTPGVPTIEVNGEERKLGCLLPARFPTALPSGTDVLGFRVWTRAEIEGYIAKKPAKMRSVFGPDWMQDQKGHASCNGCATAYLERKIQYRRGRIDTPVLNWEYAYAQMNGGQDQGSMLEDGLLVAQNIGMPALGNHTIGAGRIYKQMFTAAENAEAKENQARTCFAVDTELELASAVIQFGGAVVAVHVLGNFMKLDRNGIVGADRGPGNHAVHVDDVEIINGELCFDHFGSWGTRLHDQGRGYLTWDRHFRETVNYHRLWAMASTNDGNDPLGK